MPNTSIQSNTPHFGKTYLCYINISQKKRRGSPLLHKVEKDCALLALSSTVMCILQLTDNGKCYFCKYSACIFLQVKRKVDVAIAIEDEEIHSDSDEYRYML